MYNKCLRQNQPEVKNCSKCCFSQLRVKVVRGPKLPINNVEECKLIYIFCTVEFVMLCINIFMFITINKNPTHSDKDPIHQQRSYKKIKLSI